MSENLADKGAHEHYRLIRESPSYRNYLMMEELRAEMQPPITLQASIEPRGVPDSGDVIEFTGRYRELAGIGYDESYQRNRRGIITRLTQLERELQEHFEAHRDKKKVYHKYIP